MGLRDIDILLVGQGIAGTVLAHTLEDAGLDFHLLHTARPGESSPVAAGIMNPITGRHFVKSWLVDALLPFAEQQYRRWENRLGSSFYASRQIHKALPGPSEQNDWLARSADPEVCHYTGEVQMVSPAPSLKPVSMGFGKIVGAGQLDCQEFLNRSRVYWGNKGAMTTGLFDPGKLVFTEGGLVHGHLRAARIIFCEGYFLKENPWFSYLPMVGTKGEALRISKPDWPSDVLVKQKIYLVPFGAETLWAGATASRRFSGIHPETWAADYLKAEWQRMMQGEPAVVASLVGMRPAVRDRRPLIGRHPVHHQLYVFNGMGSKGTSLAPYWAKHFVSFLLGEIGLSQEVCISRFPFQ